MAGRLLSCAASNCLTGGDFRGQTMHRFALTTTTLLCVYSAYWAYAAVVCPLVRVTRASTEMVPSPAHQDVSHNTLQEDIAHAFLPRETWAPQASYFWQRSEDAFLYFDEWLLVDDERHNKVRLSPFAVVWFDADQRDREPYIITAHSALVEFESKVELSEQDPGRIMRADLVGVVTITGPDGLKLVGKEFTFDETEGRMYSAWPVTFAAGPSADRPDKIQGQANQFELSFEQTDESPHGDGMPNIGGLTRVLLRRDVHVELTSVVDDTPTHATVDSDGQFSYAVKDQVASFEDNVRVVRPTPGDAGKEAFDRLQCERLSLAFVPKEDAPVRREPHELNLDLRLQQLWAVGQRVELQSDEHQLAGQMQELRYDLDARTIVMLDNEKVTVQLADDVLQCPSVRLVHDKASQFREAECLGLGRLMHHVPDTTDIDLQIDWKRSMSLRPDPETGWDLLVLEGEARAMQPARQTGAAADVIRIWVDRDLAHQQMGARHEEAAPADAPPALPVKRIVAQTGVAIVSPSVHIETQQLVADVVPANLGDAGAAAGGTPQNAHTPSPFVGPTSSSEAKPDPVLISAEHIVAQIAHDPNTGKTDLASADATRGVTVRRVVESANAHSSSDKSAAQRGSFAVQADRLQLANDQGQVLRLLGAPARIRLAEGEIEGHDIVFRRQENQAEVFGEGALTILVPQDLEGKQLKVPQPLTVQWEEGMKFDGRRADFLANVRTRLADSLMRCEEMVLLLDRRLSFTEDNSSTSDVKIEELHCRKTVEAQYVTWDEGAKLVGIRKAALAEFSANLPTGKFWAQGPGWVADWRRGQTMRVGLAPDASASANQPAESRKFDWEYMRLDFAGNIEGNHHEQYATLYDRVQVMYGPVSDPNMTINRDKIFSAETDQSRDCVWLGSDQLRVSLVDANVKDARSTIEVVASGNAELEGQRFRARAHSISYEEAKELFILRGRGNDASIWHWSKPGAEPAQATARTIQAVPGKRQLVLDGTRRVWGVH